MFFRAHVYECDMRKWKLAILILQPISLSLAVASLVLSLVDFSAMQAAQNIAANRFFEASVSLWGIHVFVLYPLQAIVTLIGLCVRRVRPSSYRLHAVLFVLQLVATVAATLGWYSVFGLPDTLHAF